MIKLTIIIPIYNSSKYIVECLDSIIVNLKCGFEKRIEVILINDGSTDDSEKKIKKYFDYEFVRYYYHDNRGCSYTRNIGIDIATGEYIWFIDSDDFISENSLETIIKLLDNKELDILVFGLEQIRDKTIRVPKIPRILEKDLDYFQDYNIIISPVNKIYKRSFLLENDLKFPLNTHMGEDATFNFKAFYYVKKIKVLEEILYCQNYGVGVTSNSNKQIEIFISFDEIYNFFREKEKYQIYKQILIDFYKKIVIKNSYLIILKDRNKSIIEQIKLSWILYKELKKRYLYFGKLFFMEQIIAFSRGFIARIFYLDKLKKNFLKLKKNC